MQIPEIRLSGWVNIEEVQAPGGIEALVATGRRPNFQPYREAGAAILIPAAPVESGDHYRVTERFTGEPGFVLVREDVLGKERTVGPMQILLADRNLVQSLQARVLAASKNQLLKI